MKTTNPPQEPPITRKALNLAKAVTRHVLDGGTKVSEEIYQERLEICRSCSSCDLDRMICLQKACGCKIKRKAKWRSESCPIDKWSRIESG